MINSTSSDWYILYTLSKHEKKVKKKLEKSNVESFLPLQMVYKQWSDRKKKVEVPLFPNYVFVKLDQKHLYKTLSIPGVLKYLSNGNGPEKIGDQEIRFIRNIDKETIQVSTGIRASGDRVKFVSGPFSGIQGVLLHQSSKNKIAVTIEQLNRTITIETGFHELEKVSA